MVTRVVSPVLAVATVLAMTAAAVRVSRLESQEVHVVERGSIAELARRGDATPESVRLAAVRLARDQVATFELCAEDAMQPARWAGAISLAVWRPSATELMTRADLDEEVLAHVRRSATTGCLTIGQGVVATDDVYAVEAIFDALPSAIAQVPLTLVVQAWRPLETVDVLLVVVAWSCALAFVGSLALRRASTIGSTVDPWEPKHLARKPLLGPGARVIAGVALLTGAFVLSGFLPHGAVLALGAGAALALVEASLALALADGGGLGVRIRVLALHPPPRPWFWLPLGLAAGAGLWALAVIATSVVPSTSESAMQSFVSWPSGLLAAAMLAVVVPVAEELFFRGFVFGTLEASSRSIAFGSAWLLFVVAHAPQTFGQWGALVAILIAGFGLTALRAASRSLLVPVVAHLTYNGILVIGAVLGE